MLTTVTLIMAACVLALLAVAVGWILGWANCAFHVPVDPKVDAINETLPGANCGGCGYVGCSEYAEAVAAGKADLTLCAPGGQGCVEAMASVMGTEAGEALPYRAVIHCSANHDQRLKRTEYKGEKTCTAANLVGGIQGCIYGCLGYGDCAVSCDYGAIEIVNGLAVIKYEKCIGCKACAKACPRSIISMVPFKAERMMVVACSNLDMGKEVKAVCLTGCIGCKACTRTDCDMVTMDGNNPVIDYDKYDTSQEVLTAVEDKCRQKSLIYVGKPSAEDLEATKDEELPDQIKADFKTSVDDTEWRG